MKTGIQIRRKSALLGLLLSSGLCHAVQPLDEASLSALHLEGLDPPAAGDVRAPVDGDVSNQTSSRVEKDLQESDAATETVTGAEPKVNPDLPELAIDSSQDFDVTNGRSSSVQISRQLSDNRSGSQRREDGGVTLQVNNRANLIQVRNIDDQRRIDPGTFQIQNIQVDSQLTVRGR